MSDLKELTWYPDPTLAMIEDLQREIIILKQRIDKLERNVRPRHIPKKGAYDLNNS